MHFPPCPSNIATKIFESFKFSPESLEFDGEGALLPLLVPFFDPLGGADVSVDVVEVLAGLVAITLHLLATVEVDVILPAVPVKEGNCNATVMYFYSPIHLELLRAWPDSES